MIANKQSLAIEDAEGRHVMNWENRESDMNCQDFLAIFKKNLLTYTHLFSTKSM